MELTIQEAEFIKELVQLCEKYKVILQANDFDEDLFISIKAGVTAPYTREILIQRILGVPNILGEFGAKNVKLLHGLDL